MDDDFERDRPPRQPERLQHGQVQGPARKRDGREQGHQPAGNSSDNAQSGVGQVNTRDQTRRDSTRYCVRQQFKPFPESALSCGPLAWAARRGRSSRAKRPARGGLMLAPEGTKMRAKRKGICDRARVSGKRGRAEDRPAPEDVAKRTGPAEGFWAGFRVGWVRGIHGITCHGTPLAFDEETQ